MFLPPASFLAAAYISLQIEISIGSFWLNKVIWLNYRAFFWCHFTGIFHVSFITFKDFRHDLVGISHFGVLGIVMDNYGYVYWPL